jgi:hypothetical protein
VIFAKPWPGVEVTLRRLFTAAVCCGMTVGLLLPLDPLPQLFVGQDEIEHLCGFALLAFVLLYPARTRLVGLAALIAAPFLVELVQHYLVLERTGSLVDAGWGVLGVGVGAACGWGPRITHAL